MTSPSGEWKQIKAIFDGAVAAADREAYLAEACGSDATLRREVEALLASHERARTFLETPAGALPGATPAGHLTGHTIGSYEIVSLVGEGGMGEVYLARDHKLDRPVALKFLPPHLAADADRLRRFHSEARPSPA